MKPFSSMGQVLKESRVAHEKAKKLPIRIEGTIFEPLTVLNGPFKGMKYPSLSAVGSAVFAKLLGSYERELHPTLEIVLERSCSEIIDIGCAEGYYAVGLAMKFENAKVYAFDSDAEARKRCSIMAKLNGVADRVIVDAQYTADTLVNFKFQEKGLIISIVKALKISCLLLKTLKASRTAT